MCTLAGEARPSMKRLGRRVIPLDSCYDRVAPAYGRFSKDSSLEVDIHLTRTVVLDENKKCYRRLNIKGNNLQHNNAILDEFGLGSPAI